MERAEADPRFAPQLEKVERAAVSTIHAFCADLMREHFESAGVDPACRILDGPELSQREAQALNDAMARVYAEGGADLEALLFGRTAKSVGELAADLYHFSLESPDPAAWLAEVCRLPLGEARAGLPNGRGGQGHAPEARDYLMHAPGAEGDPDATGHYAAA